MFMIINCVVGAVFTGLVAVALGADTGGAVIAGVIGAIALFVGQVAWLPIVPRCESTPRGAVPVSAARPRLS